MTLHSIKSYVIFIKPFRNCIKISTQAIFTSSRLNPEEYQALPSALLLKLELETKRKRSFIKMLSKSGQRIEP